MHNLSGHYLQFIVVFIIKTSVLLSRVLGKKVALLLNGATRCSTVCMLCFVLVFQCHTLKRHRPIDKKCTFFSCT